MSDFGKGVEVIGGSFLIVEALSSVLYSTDQRTLSTIGRLIRTGLGIYFVGQGLQKK